MKKAKVEWAANHGTSQIYNSGPELALCSDDNRQIGTFVYCKDFFQDAIVACLHDRVCSIYGYKWSKGMPPCPEKNTKVLLANAGDGKIADKVAGVADFLNQFETAMGVTKTEVFECENPPHKYKGGVYLLVGDPIWMHAPPVLSGWTLLARNGLQHTPKKSWEETVNAIIGGKVPPAQSHDHTYLQYGKPGLDLMLQRGVKALFGENKKANYPPDKAGSAMHHYSGIVSFGSCKAKPHFPNWVYPDKATNPPGVCFS